MIRDLRSRRARGSRSRRVDFELLEQRLMFSVVSSPIPADLNHDNVVNSQDLAIVSSNWLGAGPVTLAGDVNHDGIVNVQDIALVSSSWLRAGPTLSPPSATADVPFTDVPVFHFTDFDSNSTAADYTAAITLGDGHALTLTSTASSNGQIVPSTSGGFQVQLSYTYTELLSGQTFAVTVTDQGGHSTSASTNNFSVGVGAPTVALPANPLTVKQSLDLPISGISVADDFLLSNTSDVQLTLTTNDGTLDLSTTVSGGVQSSQITQNGTGTVTVTAPLAAINATLAALNGVIYTPASGYSGADTLTATINDLGHTGSGIPQTVSHSVAIDVTAGGILPTDVPGLQLWLDPSDLSTLDLRTTAYLAGASQQSLDTAAGPNSYDFATHSKFSFAGWVYFNQKAGDSFSSTQQIIGENETSGGNGVFSLTLTGSGYDSQLDFVVWTGQNNAASVYTATGPAGSPFISGHDYFIAVKFDGSQATDGGKLSIWVDGTKLALQNPNGSVLPGTLQDDTASTDQLVLGNPSSATNMSLRMEDWGVWDNVAFNQTDVNSLWNSGAGLTVTSLSALPNNIGAGGSNLASPTMYWRLDETGGTRHDLSGNNWNLTPSSNDGSDVGDKLQVISWTDKSGVLGAFYAGDGPEAVFQMKRMREPTYDPNALGPGRPGIIFGQYQWLYNGVANWMANSPTGAIYQNVLVGSTLAPYEDFFLSSSADTDTTPNSERIFMTGYYGGQGDGAANVNALALRINDTAGNSTGLGNEHPHAAVLTMNYGTRTAFPGNYYMSPGELMSFEWADVGAPGAGGLYPGPWRAYVNGAQQTLYVSDGGTGNTGGDWAELATGRSDQMLNGFYDSVGYQSFTQVGSTTTFGDVVAFGAAPTGTDEAQLRSMMMERAGLSGLLSPLPQVINTSATTYITSSLVSCTGATSALILPPVAAAQNEQLVVNNNGSSTAVIHADSGTDILLAGSTSGVSSLNLRPGQSATLVSDGTNWRVVTASQSTSMATTTTLGSSDPIPAAVSSSNSASPAAAASSRDVLLTSAPSFNTVPSLDRLAAFVGKSETNTAALDTAMSQLVGDSSFKLNRWNTGQSNRATTKPTFALTTNGAPSTASPLWAPSLDERALEEIAAAIHSKWA